MYGHRQTRAWNETIARARPVWLALAVCVGLVGCADPLGDLRAAADSFELPPGFTPVGAPQEIDGTSDRSASYQLLLSAEATTDRACIDAKLALEQWTGEPATVVDRPFSTDSCEIGLWSPDGHDGVEFVGFKVNEWAGEPGVSSVVLAFFEKAPYDESTAVPTPRPTAAEPYVYEPVLRSSADLAGVGVANRQAFDEYIARIQERGQLGIVECMELEGFEYFPRHYVGATGRMPTTADRELVERQGFGIAAPIATGEAIARPDESAMRNSSYVGALTRLERERYGEVLGVERVSGCRATALADVDRLDAVVFALVDPITSAQQDFETDPRLAALREEWSACMAEVGHDFARREMAEVYIGQKLRDITQSAGSETATDVVTGLDTPVDREGHDAVAALIEEERALALATFDCEAETQAERLQIESEYNERFFTDHGPTIDEVLAEFR